MNKQVVMLLFGLALIGGFFLFSRRASAATGPDAAAPGASNGVTGATGALISAPAQSPDGQFAPIPFEGSAALPGATGIKGSGTPIATATPAAPAAVPLRVSTGGGQPRKGDPIHQRV